MFSLFVMCVSYLREKWVCKEVEFLVHAYKWFKGLLDERNCDLVTRSKGVEWLTGQR